MIDPIFLLFFYLLFSVLESSSKDVYNINKENKEMVEITSDDEETNLTLDNFIEPKKTWAGEIPSTYGRTGAVVWEDGRCINRSRWDPCRTRPMSYLPTIHIIGNVYPLELQIPMYDALDVRRRLGGGANGASCEGVILVKVCNVQKSHFTNHKSP